MNWTLVTGGAKGLGASICHELAKKGYPVIIQYRTSRQQAEEVQKRCVELGVKAEIIQGDFSSEGSTQKFIDECKKRFQALENLVNNVGNYLVKPLLETSMTEWRELYQSNVFSALQLIEGLLPTSSIVNIGVVGVQRVDSYSPAYTASKMTLWMMTKTLAKDLKGIRVNMISPGYMENAVDLPADLSKLPQGRAIELTEVAKLVPFLFENPSITGQNIEIAGGVRL